MNLTYIEKIGYTLGIKFDFMTIYRAELIHLKNDGNSSKDISIILDVPVNTVNNWFNKSSQPKDKIIEKLKYYI